MNRSAVVLALLLAGFEALGAQETTGAIRGRLAAAGGGGITGAIVTATSPDLLGERRAVSRGDGVYTLLALPPGTYTLRVAAIGYRPVVLEQVTVQLGRMSGLGDLVMEPAAVALAEITITAPRMTLDPVRTTIGASLSAADYRALPGDRDYKSLMTILPHVNTSYHGDPPNSGGSTGLENMYFIDGVNVTSPLKGARGTRLPHNFVRAVELRAGGYEAQYGKALGAIVNAVTYTGSNDLEAEGFGFFTHDALSATPRAQPTLVESGAYSFDAGLRVSGPVVRNHVWFSTAYNRRVDHTDKQVVGLGQYPDRETAHVFAGKLTWQAHPTATLEFSGFGDPTVRHEVDLAAFATLTPLNADPYLKRLESGGTTATMRALWAPRPRLLLEAALSRYRGRENSLGDTERARTDPFLVDFDAGTVEGGSVIQLTGREGRTAARLQATLEAGSHTPAVGFEFEDSRLFRRLDQPAFIVHANSQFEATTQFTEGTYHNRSPTVHLQDTWRATDRLTVNAGLRWSGQFLSSASNRTAQRFPDEWQPRLGFSWVIGAGADERVFASAGRFYQQSPLSLSWQWYGDWLGFTLYYDHDPRLPGAVVQDSVDCGGSEQDLSVAEAKAEHYDELTVGYERRLGSATRLVLRGVRRELRSSFQQGLDSLGNSVLGTPGTGEFAFLPPVRRRYTALEASAEGALGALTFRASYVLSRTWGNYTGLYSSDLYFGNPGFNLGYAHYYQARHSKGLLPNDRTHVLKLSGAWRVSPALTVGTVMTAASGTPISELGGSPFGLPRFLSQRGTVGRTSAILDLNFRLAYDAPIGQGASTRLVLDLLRVGNRRTAVRVDQQRFFSEDEGGNQTNPNPDYLRATAFQPPMAARIGLEVRF